MNKSLRMLLLLIPLLASELPLSARQIAAVHFGHVIDQQIAQNSSKKIALKLALHEIENAFGVSVAYQSKLITGKKVAFDISSCSSAEDAFKKVLTPFSLRFENVRDHFYFISPVQQEDESPLRSLRSAITDEQTLHGKVVDEQGNALPGVTVQVSGTHVGTVTDQNGNFTLNVPDTAGEKLEVSYIGYEHLVIPVTSTNMNIVLKRSTNNLNELVVTGYSTEKKKDLIGAVTVVNVDDMTKQPIATVSRQLQGQASGVTVISSGQPGEDPQIRIRGVNTFGNNSPLYVVNGVPTEDISDLNPNDVASIQVLKDAASASIYGARAANGVIIITTKQGAGKLTVKYDAYYGTQQPERGNVFHILNPMEQAQLRFNALANSGTPISATNPDAQYGSGPDPVLPDYIDPAGAKTGDPAVDPSKYNIDPYYSDPGVLSSFYYITPANKSGTDWFHSIFHSAPITSHNISVSGGGDKANYLLSLNYFNQQGTLMETYLKRYTIRANTQLNISKHIRIGENMAYSITSNPQVSELDAYGAIAYTFRMQPIVPVYDIMGNYAASHGKNLGDGHNPVAIQDRTRNNRSYANHLLGNIYADIDFLKYFTIHTSFGGESYAGFSHSFTYPTYELGENTTTNAYSASSDYGYNWTWTNTLTFHKIFNDVHDVKILVGTEAYDNSSHSQDGTTQGYFSFDPTYTNLSTGSGIQTNSSSKSTDGIFSLIGRADYSYQDKYLLSATIRRDGSSRFLNYQYGWFPAISAGWRISQESFMKKATWITDMKIRGGYGIMGNQINVSPGNAYTTYIGDKSESYYDIDGTNNSTVLGFQQGRYGNPDAKWEKDINLNIGLDATLFNDLLSITADYYRKDIKDLLYNPELIGSAGTADVPYVNIGRMKNEGVDLSVMVNTNITSDLKFSGSLNFTTYRNTIVKVANGTSYFDLDGRDFDGQNIIRNAVGQSVSSFFGYKIVGFWNSEDEISQANEAAQKSTGDDDAIYQTDMAVGRFKYQDTNGDGLITADDRTFLGNPNPKFSYGINLALTYKQLDFSLFLYGVQGNQIWNNVRWWTDFYPSFGGPKSWTALYDAWTPDKHNAKAPIQENAGSFSTNAVPTSYYVENGSYLRAKNIQLGYSFAPGLLKKISVEKLRVYIQAANLFTITKYSGLDPEIGGDGVTDYGIDEGTYPSQKEYLIGVNLSF